MLWKFTLNFQIGVYSSATIAGSRPGGLIACAYASLVSIGESGTPMDFGNSK